MDENDALWHPPGSLSLAFFETRQPTETATKGTEPAPARDHDTMLPLSGGGFVDRRYALLIFKSLCPDMRSEL